MTTNHCSVDRRSFADRFALKTSQELSDSLEDLVHIYGKNNVICDTNRRGFTTPDNRNPAELVLDSSEGFIPLWAKNTTLKWRFQERSFAIFENPTLAKEAVRDLLAQGIMQWGSASPVKFEEDTRLWDFEISIVPSENCNPRGCVLASAFFPNSGRNFLRFYPTFFRQSLQEQIETVIHELGHIFGLRHFFANVSETAFPSVLFGTQSEFTIMNYGPNSMLTENDKRDLETLYNLVWSNQFDSINNTPIVLFRPYHMFLTSNISC